MDHYLCWSSLFPCVFTIICFTQMIADGQEVPLDVLRNLAVMQPKDVLQQYGVSSLFPVGSDHPQTLALQIEVVSGRGRSGAQRSSMMLPSPAATPDTQLAENAGCAPTDSVIEMPRMNSSVVVYPVGTKVKRCAGFCGHPNLLCRPTQTRTFERKGLILVYKNGVLVPTGHANFPLEDHVACSCECAQKATDCGRLQRYESNNCKCVCRNQEEMQSCGPHRVWDFKECRCKCPNVCTSCSFGMVFDDKYSCTCIVAGSRQGHRRH